MIDFHTHILPNIDDGSKSIEETFNLIKEAEKAGFKNHINITLFRKILWSRCNRKKSLDRHIK